MLFVATLLAASVAIPQRTNAELEARPEDRIRLVRVDVRQLAGGASELVRRDFDVVYREPSSTRVELAATAAELERLDDLGLAYEIVEEDLVSFYVQRFDAGEPDGSAPSFGSWLNPPFGQGSMSGYYTWAEVGEVLNQIASAYPAIVAPPFSIGTSVEGRALFAIKLSDNPGTEENEPEVRFDALHHAREPGGMQTVLWTLLGLVESYGTDPLATWIVDNREMWFLPVMNPDGYVYNQTTNPNGGGMWRKNRRNNGGGSIGVDLNRNYPYEWGFDNNGSSPSPSSSTYRGPSPMSEPEVSAMVAFMASREFSTAITAHTYSNLWLAPWCYTPTPPPDQAKLDEIGALATEVNGYPYGIGNILLYPFNGTTNDTDYGMFQTFAWLPEIGSSSDGFWPPTTRIVPLAEENRLGFYRTALAAGAFVHVTSQAVTDTGDGDGNLEPGETHEIRLAARNSGRLTTTGDVTVTLSSSSPELLLGTTGASLGAMPGFTSADNDATALTFTVASGADVATIVSYTVTFAWESFSETFTTVVPIGDPALLVRDRVEVDLGWTAGLPGDTATSGLWEFGDPVGTTSGGQPANPEDDATAGGVNCFTTGNGSTSPGGDDVDDGFTTLLSPVIDLSSATAAVVSYSRWFADLTVEDDCFEVSISNDDGASWVTVETLDSNANAWNEAGFLVNSFVAPTAEMRLRFVASDDPSNSIVEGAVDELEVTVFDGKPHVCVYGRATLGSPLSVQASGEPGARFVVNGSMGTANLQLPNVVGPILIQLSSIERLAAGFLPGDGLSETLVLVPDDPALLGQTFYVQGLVITGGQLVMTNRDEVTFQ